LMLVPFVIGARVVGPLQIVATITLDARVRGSQCVAVNEETNRIYVGMEDRLVIIDGETDTVVAEILPDTEVVALAVNPQTNRVYIAEEKECVIVIDGDTNQQLGEILQGMIVQDWIAVNPVTNLIYIGDWTHFMGQFDQVTVYSGETNTLVTSVNIRGSNEHRYEERVGVAVNPETNRVYATWSGDDTLHMIDGNTHLIMQTVRPPSFSEKVMVNPYTNYVYVGDVVLNGETLEELTSDYQGNLRTIDPVNNLLYTYLYMDSVCTLYVLDGTTHDILTSLEIGESSHIDAIAVNCETGKVYIVDTRAHETQIAVVARAPATPTTPAPSAALLPPEAKAIYVIAGVAIAVISALVIKKQRK